MRGYDIFKSKTRRLSLFHLPQTRADNLLLQGREREQGRTVCLLRTISAARKVWEGEAEGTHLTENVSDNPLGACHFYTAVQQVKSARNWSLPEQGGRGGARREYDKGRDRKRGISAVSGYRAQATWDCIFISKLRLLQMPHKMGCCWERERERERERGGTTAETGAESFELRLYPVFNKLSSARRSRGVKARAKLCRYLSNFIASG